MKAMLQLKAGVARAWPGHLCGASAPEHLRVCKNTLRQCQQEGTDSSQLRGQMTFGLPRWCSGEASYRERLSCRRATVGLDKHAPDVSRVREAIWRRMRERGVGASRVRSNTSWSRPQIRIQTFPAAPCPKPQVSLVLEKVAWPPFGTGEWPSMHSRTKKCVSAKRVRSIDLHPQLYYSREYDVKHHDSARSKSSLIKVDMCRPYKWEIWK